MSNNQANAGSFGGGGGSGSGGSGGSGSGGAYNICHTGGGGGGGGGGGNGSGGTGVGSGGGGGSNGNASNSSSGHQHQQHSQPQSSIPQIVSGGSGSAVIATSTNTVSSQADSSNMIIDSSPRESGDDSEDESEILEESPCGRWLKRREEVDQRDVPGIDCVHLAMDTEEGVEVVWNEVQYASLQELKSQEDKMRQVFDNLLQLDHPNIVKFHRYWTDTLNIDRPRVIFITEYMSSGSLKKFLQRTKRNSKRLPLEAWKRWCTQILSALSYLHSCTPPVIHGNLTCDSILIQHNGLVKIGSVVPDAVHYNVSQHLAEMAEQGSRHFMAPEYSASANEQQLTAAVDIYAFGMCALEMAALEIQPSNSGDTNSIGDETILRTINSLEHDLQRDLIFKCLRNNPACRPSANDLLFHPLLFEVHSLKLLSAHCLVSSPLSRTMFSETVLDGMMQRYNRPDVILALVVNRANGEEKQYRLSDVPAADKLEKFVEDVKYGVYPLTAFSRKKPPHFRSRATSPERKDSTKSATPEPVDIESRRIVNMMCSVKKVREDSNDISMTILLRMDDKMNRQLTCQVTEDDSAIDLTNELVRLGFVHIGDQEKIQALLEETLNASFVQPGGVPPLEYGDQPLTFSATFNDPNQQQQIQVVQVVSHPQKQIEQQQQIIENQQQTLEQHQILQKKLENQQQQIEHHMQIEQQKHQQQQNLEQQHLLQQQQKNLEQQHLVQQHQQHQQQLSQHFDQQQQQQHLDHQQQMEQLQHQHLQQLQQQRLQQQHQQQQQQQHIPFEQQQMQQQQTQQQQQQQLLQSHPRLEQHQMTSHHVEQHQQHQQQHQIPPHQQLEQQHQMTTPHQHLEQQQHLSTLSQQQQHITNQQMQIPAHALIDQQQQQHQVPSQVQQQQQHLDPHQIPSHHIDQQQAIPSSHQHIDQQHQLTNHTLLEQHHQQLAAHQMNQQIPTHSHSQQTQQMATHQQIITHSQQQQQLPSTSSNHTNGNVNNGYTNNYYTSYTPGSAGPSHPNVTIDESVFISNPNVPGVNTLPGPASMAATIPTSIQAATSSSGAVIDSNSRHIPIPTNNLATTTATNMSTYNQYDRNWCVNDTEHHNYYQPAHIPQQIITTSAPGYVLTSSELQGSASSSATSTITTAPMSLGPSTTVMYIPQENLPLPPTTMTTAPLQHHHQQHPNHQQTQPATSHIMVPGPPNHHNQHPQGYHIQAQLFEPGAISSANLVLNNGASMALSSASIPVGTNVSSITSTNPAASTTIN